MIAPRAEGVKPSIGFNFVALPVEVLRRTDLSPAAKLLLAVVMDSARGSRAGTCRLSNATLGARIGKSAATIKRLLAELEAAGLVRRDTLADKHVRTAVVPTWVAQERTAEQASAAQERAGGGAETTRGAAQNRATFQNPPSEPNFQTGPILSTLGGEKIELDPKPSAAEVAEALRAMLAGRYAPQLFEGAKGVHEARTPARQPSGAPSKGIHQPNTPAHSTRPPGSLQPPDARPLFARVGYSARAAIVQAKPPRKTADQQLAELAESRRRRREATAIS